MGDDVQGRTIGIIGIGHVGSRVAELCRGLFQMRVIAYDPYQTAEQIAAKGAEKAATLEDLLRRPTTSRSTARTPRKHAA